MKKRIVSICLVVCLAISLSAPAAATNVVDSDASVSYGLEDGTLVSLQKSQKESIHLRMKVLHTLQTM